MARVKSSRSPTAVLQSGPLKLVLAQHAERRAVYFFEFLFFLRAACDLVFNGSGDALHPSDLVREAATHQIDQGLRRSVGRDAFDPRDAQIVDKASTCFSRIDAAHFCNLGLDGDFPRLEARARQDEGALDVIAICKALAGDTTWLPQQINLGPDRVIDQLHYALAIDFLEQPAPVFKPANIGVYANEAMRRMQIYALDRQRAGEVGLAACADCYGQAYLNLEAAIADSIRSTIEAECEARHLVRERYRGR